MTFELVTNATVTNTSYPSNDDISVRFLFSNGSASANPLTIYPLFGQSETVIPWNTFVDQMNEFAIGDQADWCSKCGNSTGVCASTTTSTSTGTSASATASSSSSGGISKAVAGVIGAMVTLAVILLAEALIMLVAGLRVVNRRRLAGNVTPPSITPAKA